MTERLSVGQTLGRAFSLLDAGRPADAGRVARGLADLRPEPGGLAYLLGLIALAEGEHRKAAQHLQRALRQSPDMAPPHLAFARSQARQGRAAETGLAYRRLLALVPDLAIGWSDWASEKLAAGDLIAAYLPLRAAVLLMPDRAAWHNNFGIAARAANKFAEADASFRRAVILDPALAKSYANLAGLLRARRQNCLAAAERARQLEPDNAAHLIEWGQAAVGSGNLIDALAAFRQAARRLPEQPEPLWLMGETLRQLGRDDEAAEHYRQILRLDPADAWGATLALAQLGKTALPPAAAPALIRALYDQYADSFERNLTDDLGYRAPELLLSALRAIGVTGGLDILDAGCGTGLMGQAVQPLAKSLIGVDLSPRMIARAAERNIYANLVVEDLLVYLRARPASFDLVLAADMLIYFGDLHPIAAAVQTVLRPGGLFAFTVERGEGAPVTLQSNRRFAHSSEHLLAAAAAAALDPVILEPTTTRHEKNDPVEGLLCILRKP
jgi:predicted TPR repeat methyltransferase